MPVFSIGLSCLLCLQGRISAKGDDSIQLIEAWKKIIFCLMLYVNLEWFCPKSKDKPLIFTVNSFNFFFFHYEVVQLNINFSRLFIYLQQLLSGSLCFIPPSFWHVCFYADFFQYVTVEYIFFLLIFFFLFAQVAYFDALV